MQIRGIQEERTNLSKAEKIYLKIQNDIFKTKIKNVKKKGDLLKNALVNIKKRKRLPEKGLKKIAKV